MWRSTTFLIGSVLTLSALGLVMLSSTSSSLALREYGDGLYFVKRQVFAMVLALAGMWVTARLPYDWWRRLALPFLGVTLLLMVLPLIPGIGVEVKGSSRWIDLGPLNFQPSELGKLAMIVSLAWYVSRNQRYMGELVRGLALPLLLLGSVLFLIFAAPDFGTTFLVAAVGMLMLLAGGTRIGYLVLTGALGGLLFSFLIMQDAVRMRRITAFLNPEKYAQNEAFQLLSAMYAFVMGGFSGTGLGQGLQKRYYLPEAHTDFIFAIIGEELGLMASLLVVLLFAVFFASGLVVVDRARDPFGRYLALGIILMITLQAGFNLAVVTGVVPTKGLALPFISYGGSSMLVSMAMVGILLNVDLQGRLAKPGGQAYTRKISKRHR
jgi:cell division protein FtsW